MAARTLTPQTHTPRTARGCDQLCRRSGDSIGETARQDYDSAHHHHTVDSVLARRDGRSARRRDDCRPHLGGHQRRGRCICGGDEHCRCRGNRASSDRPRHETSSAAELKRFTTLATFASLWSHRTASARVPSRLVTVRSTVARHWGEGGGRRRRGAVSGDTAKDSVSIFIDDKLAANGTTWEDYYRYDPEQTPTGNMVPTVDKLLFRRSGPPSAGTLGNGFLLDRVTLEFRDERK